MSLLSFKQSKSRRFEQLVQPHLDVLYRFAFRLSGQQQDAEDLVQDVVVKLYPRLDELEAVEQLRPWLNRVLYRHFIDQVRRKSRQGDVVLSDLVEADGQADWLDSLESDNAGPDLMLEHARLGPALDRVLATLPPDQRTLVLLHDVDGWRQEEIADILDIPLGTVKSRLHRCRAALRKKIHRELEPTRHLERVGE
ncbi:sigma-70 family RNA polymerase sigma factor [Marinobacter salinisoli]|uniref:Sigma-70 family RNA polymerase sigma factor n=1 Tax=Marinobacter salinisoli TaxID=2769486 RepID=A0ABX7MUI1_9GAMM|nr:sigma-70 family RNA polymerase sigma factor [Marinobacter salinisoli]QSP95964.1 sigma-70 family RNA polymerase sigma factor [Marinobacter salinisoli]